MYGAIIGDIIGSPFEYDRGEKTTRFELYSDESHFTEDTVLTVAVADALIKTKSHHHLAMIQKYVEYYLRKWSRAYPDAGYNDSFSAWLASYTHRPLECDKADAVVRTAPIGWAFDNMRRTRDVARSVAQVTHTHPDAIRGADCLASAIFIARRGDRKDNIAKYLVDNFGYNITTPCESIRMRHHHDDSATVVMTNAIIAFMEGNSYENVIRTAVSLGGDTDTVAAVAGAMAEGYYRIPFEIRDEAKERAGKPINDVMKLFYKRFTKRVA